MTERWATIPGFRERYQVSDQGRVRSVDYLDSRGTLRKGRPMSPSYHYKGYVLVSLRGPNGDKTLKVARLVAQAFVPNPHHAPQVNHKDGVKTNNAATNLEWATNAENTQHAYDTGLKPKRYGAEADAALYRYEVIDSKGVMVDTLCGSREIRAKGYQDSIINKVIKGERRHHRGMNFRKIPL